MESIDKRFTFKDKNGNWYICHSGRITLRLASETRERHIGEVGVSEDKIIFSKKDKEKDIHRKTNAWSVPVGIFEKVDGIRITTERTEYRILTSTARQNMEYLHFLKSGYELKVYIPLKYWWRK